MNLPHGAMQKGNAATETSLLFEKLVIVVKLVSPESRLTARNKCDPHSYRVGLQASESILEADSCGRST
jgi:hypothetical protein